GKKPAGPGKAGPAAPGNTGPAAPAPKAAPGTDAKKSGAAGGAGAGTKPAPQALSPHHAGTDQPDKQGAPAKPAGDKPADPKPADAKPTKPAGDKPADPKPTGDKPAGDKPAGGPTPAADEPPAGGHGGHGGETTDEGETTEADEGEETADAAPTAAPDKPKEFPVGSGGKALIVNLAHLRALRELGVLTDGQKEEYELAESKENLTVFFKGGKQHSLIIGARVFGGGDRYVMNAETGKGYVLSNSEIMRHIDGAENSLGLKQLHAFQEEPADEAPVDPKAPKPKRDKYPGVGQIEVETPDGARTLLRHEQPDPQGGGTIMGWADKKKPGESDMTFANFLTQLERLRPVEFDTAIDETSMTKLLTLRYKKSGGELLGTFELFRKDPTVTPELEPSEESKKGNEPEYYVKTELTRLPGKVGRMAAERLAEDVPQLFGAPAKPRDDKRPVLKEPGAVPGHGEAGQPAPRPAPAKAPTKAGADNPAGAAPDKTGASRPAAPAAPASGKPAGSKPNPTEGNK
ncbi:MAG TPA: hypothetical protein VNO33_20295, partial [Kofleriaceae bacterium]|nr:hypothetical protein [Kofleriaceae bacterium]